MWNHMSNGAHLLLEDTEGRGEKTGEEACEPEAYIRKGVKCWPMSGKADDLEGDDQKEKTQHFLLLPVLLKSDFALAHFSFFRELRPPENEHIYSCKFL